MHQRFAHALYWLPIGFVAAAFVLAVAGEETSSAQARAAFLHGHEWLGLLSLVTLIAALVARWRDKTRRRRPLPNWLPGLRRAAAVALYTLLLLQPLSGWLLASYEGRLTAFLGWSLPPLAAPNATLAEYGYVYHGLGGVLIVLIGALSLRVNLTAFVFASIARRRRRRRRAMPEAHHESRHRTTPPEQASPQVPPRAEP